MDRSTKYLIRKVIIDCSCLFIVGITILIFFLIGQPYQRGFFCNDESLMHPYKESTVTSFMLYITGLLLPICTIIACEYHHCRRLPSTSSLSIRGYTVSQWAINAYNKIGMFGFGAATTVLTTDIAKYSIGRLRPHFILRCIPSIPCQSNEYKFIYNTNFTCLNNKISERDIKEMRLSFPSGHSSFSAYTMIYLALYLQLRFTWKGSKLLRHVLQLICLWMAWFTAMSRVSDYKHHWSDVLAGSTIGTVVALIMVFAVSDLFAERRISLTTSSTNDIEKNHRQIDYDPATSADGTQVNNNGTRVNDRIH